jgi:deazaflavin-dependent oxidoreductase (nitroreductase family)
MTDAKDFNQQIIDEFRANGGKVGGRFEGAPLLLLHSTGAKSGRERVNPVTYRRDSDHLVIFGTKAGAPTNPDWYHNLVANPRAKVEVGSDTLEVVAHVAEGEERERLWNRQKHDVPPFADYEQQATREIPVVILEPAA